MNYEEMSDFEINGSVNNARFNKEISDFNSESILKQQIFNESTYVPDYCNDPSDAWPIINDARISILPEVNNVAWYAEGRIKNKDKDNKWHYPNCTNANPLRAAMIVYLMMQEVK